MAVLEFDIVPESRRRCSSKYVFASEEYPQFVCSPYNDVFGFASSARTPAPPPFPSATGTSYSNTNIALLPHSTLPVCINSINSGTPGTWTGATWSATNCVSLDQSSLFVDNLTPVNSDLVYNGRTAVLTAKVSVVPHESYHLKIAISDVGDRIYDSAVFLQGNSFIIGPRAIAQVGSASRTLDFPPPKAG